MSLSQCDDNKNSNEEYILYPEERIDQKECERKATPHDKVYMSQQVTGLIHTIAQRKNTQSILTGPLQGELSPRIGTYP